MSYRSPHKKETKTVNRQRSTSHMAYSKTGKFGNGYFVITGHADRLVAVALARMVERPDSRNCRAAFGITTLSTRFLFVISNGPKWPARASY